MDQPTTTDVLVNTCYMCVLSTELMLRDVERRLQAMSATIQRDKKYNFNRFCDSTKKALHFAEMLTDDIFKVDEEHNFKNIPVWQEESNELARLILLYADKSANVDNMNAIFKFLRELPGAGLIDEKTLDYYRLKKL